MSVKAWHSGRRYGKKVYFTLVLNEAFSLSVYNLGLDKSSFLSTAFFSSFHLISKKKKKDGGVSLEVKLSLTYNSISFKDFCFQFALFSYYFSILSKKKRGLLLISNFVTKT